MVSFLILFLLSVMAVSRPKKVSAGHVEGLVSEHSGDLGDRRVVHRQLARCRMTQIMKAEILDAGFRYRFDPGFLEIERLRQISTRE
jgi:hypothetical protein